jgi:hypothetical protein
MATWWWWWCRWGETSYLNRGHQRTCCSYYPGDIWAWRTMVEWYRQGRTDSSTIDLWQAYQQLSSSKAGGTGEGNYEFCLTKYLLHISMGSLTCLTILRHRADGFTSSPKDFYRPWPGLNPRPLGQMASTLTAIPPMTTDGHLIKRWLFWDHHICGEIISLDEISGPHGGKYRLLGHSDM